MDASIGEPAQEEPARESPLQRLRSLRKAAMLTAGVGAAHAVLFLVSWVLLSDLPGPAASTAEIQLATGMCTSHAALRRRRRRRRSSRPCLSDGDIDPVVAHQFPEFGSTLMIVFALRMAAMFVFTTSTIGRGGRVMPAWFAWSGYFVGVFLLLSASLEPWLALVFPIWLLVLERDPAVAGPADPGRPDGRDTAWRRRPPSWPARGRSPRPRCLRRRSRWCRAVDEARVQVVDRPDAEQPQRPHELLVQQLEHARDAGRAAEGEPVDGHPADQHGVGAEGDGAGDVVGPAHPGVEQDRRVAADRGDDLGQDVDRGRRALELTAAVVRDDDAVGTGVDGTPRRPRRP